MVAIFWLFKQREKNMNIVAQNFDILECIFKDLNCQKPRIIPLKNAISTRVKIYFYVTALDNSETSLKTALSRVVQDKMAEIILK